MNNNVGNTFDINKVLEKIDREVVDPISVGIYNAKTANQWVRDAALRSNPTNLWNECWYEGEVCCMFADSNIGKSILAVQIGIDIAKSQKVMYFDYELSDKQFQLRYSQDGVLFPFPNNFYRVEINSMNIPDDFEDAAIGDMESIALKVGAKVIIIDNITWLCTDSEKGGDATVFMKKLLSFKSKYGWSLLVIAHTPKRNLCSPITQNDLGGSKRLFNFFDSVFAIGKSTKDEALRYVKQVKVRYGGYKYDSDNVMLFEIEKVDAFTRFIPKGYSTEREHLQEQTLKDDEETLSKVKELHADGNSIRAIASELGLSKSKVARLIKK